MMRNAPAPLAEVVIVAGLFFGIVSLDAAMSITPRVLWSGYSIRGSVQRLTEEAELCVRHRGYVPEEPLLRAGDEWRIETASLICEHEEQSQTKPGQRLLEPAPVKLKFRARAQRNDRFLASLDRPQSPTIDQTDPATPDVRIRLRSGFPSSSRP